VLLDEFLQSARRTFLVTEFPAACICPAPVTSALSMSPIIRVRVMFIFIGLEQH
jgi:hypothetical protein